MKKIKQNIVILLIILLLIPLNVNASSASSICGDDPNCPKYVDQYLGSIASAIAEKIQYIPNISVCSGGATLCFQGDVDSNGLGGRGLYLKVIKYNDDKTETIIGKPILLWNGSFLNSVSSVVDNGANAEVNGYGTYDGNTCTYRYFINFDGASIVEFNKENIKYYIDNSSTTYEVNKIYDENLPSTNDAVVDYVKQTLIGKYFSTPEKVKSNFSLTSSEYQDFLDNMDKYYFSFEPAQRSTNVTSVDGMTEVSSSQIEHSVSEGTGTKSTAWFCKSPRQYKYQNNKPSASDCNDGTYICSGTKESFSSEDDCKESCSSSCELKNLWSSYSYCSSNKKEYYQTMKIHYYSAPSYVRPARYTSSLNLIASIVTPKDETDCNNSTENGYSNCVKNPVYIEEVDSDGNKTGENIHATDNAGNKMYEYYIGPTLKTALVGTEENNKYKLWNSSITLTKDNLSTYKSQNYALGVSYWWFPNVISCQNACNIANKSSDEFLKCAENYCDNSTGYDDRMNTQRPKYSCITKTCGYTYTKMTCKTDENPNANIYSKENNYNSSEITQSTCSILNSDGTTKTENSSKTITTCEVYDENKKIFDQNTYLVVACKESSAFQYADLSKTKIIAGEGLNYFANLHGGKECTVSFDIDAWKVAYASYHSEDQICLDGTLDENRNCVGGTVVSPRKLLENMLNYYNKCSLGVTDEETKKLCDVGGDAIGINMDGTPVTTTWESLGYNTSKVEVKTQVTEIIDNEKVKSDSYTLIQNKDKTDNSIVATSEKDAYSFAANKKISFGKVKTYLSTSNVEANYTFDKYCVTTDGKATIYKASADGKCKQDETTIESEDVFGKNVYFTSLNATPNSEITSNDKHAIEYTNVTVKNENDITYLTGQEYCPYKIEDIGLSCTIEIELMDSTTAHGNDIYDGKVKAKLRINNQLGTKDSIVGKGISTSERTTNGTEELEVSMLNPKNGAEIKDIYGIVTTKNGETVTCDKKIKLINPGNACSINKVEDNLYEIVTSYPGQTYYALTYDIKLHQEFTTYPKKAGFKAILKENGKNYVRVNEQSKSSRLYGAVIGSSGGYEVCWTDIMEYEDKEHPQCKTQCTNRTSAIEVQTFCNANWHEDIDNYSSYSDCVTNCKCELPSDLTCEIEKIKNYCETRYHECGFKDVSTCISYVYNELNCSGADYIYRPVNNSNPFPNSYESPIPGDRIIGGNWVGKTEYITDDSKDSTSVTGANAGNGQVEYEIHLTPSDIQEIRKNTEAYMSEGKNPYLDYIGVEQGKDGYCLEEGYCSEFINSSEFSTTIFKVK